MTSRRATKLVLATILLVGLVAPPALADFPYPAPAKGQDPYAYEDYMNTADGEYPSDIGRNKKEYWEYSSKSACELYGPAAPDTPPSPKFANCSPVTRVNPQELTGVTGASVDRAWASTTGRPDVVIAIHDSGVTWTNLSKPMFGQNNKTWLNRGELPLPDWGTPHPKDPYDRNGDGVFNIKDYCPEWEQPKDCGDSGDSRVRGALDANDTDLNNNGIIDPEDLIFLFSDGIDDDSNGYLDDFVGWDTYEDDNNPYDEVTYGHGSGEANDSTGEVQNGKDGDKGSCPNCMSMHLRVGNSFIADVNDFAEGVLYATDNGASVIQSALGTLNNSRFAQEAIDYAYRRGVVLIASAADESAGHHNQPSVLEHAVTMNSIGEPQAPGAGQPPSYLEFRGCTNFGAYITAAVPSNSCSSEAVGRSAGMAGLAYAAARNAVARNQIADYASLPGAGSVTPGRGISAEELDQLIATTADDLNFVDPPYTDRSIPETKRYPATPGWDPFFGYGRINSRRIVDAITANKIPPEADITSPKWFDIISPRAGAIEISGRVASIRSPKYSYSVQWGIWSWKGPVREAYTRPNYSSDGVTLTRPGDQEQPHEGLLATIDASKVKAALDAANAGKGTEGPGINPATGRGENENEHNPDKFGVIVRVVATAKDAEGRPITTPYDSPDGGGDPNVDRRTSPPALTGVGTKNFFMHEDPALFPGYFKDLEGDGAAAPRFADLDDDGVDEMIVATSNGEIHAFEATGGEVPGWPVLTSDAQMNYGAPAYSSGEITLLDGKVRAAVLRSPAIGDLDRDGDLEVVVGDFMGRLFAFDQDGRLLPGFPVRSNPVWSSPQRLDREQGFYGDHPELVPGDFPRPDLALPNDPDLVPDLVNRRGRIGPFKPGGNGNDPNRTHWAFLAAPSLADIDGDGQLEILAGATDRHLYAFKLDGSPVPGWPVFLRDPSKLDGSDSVDPVSRLVLDDEGADRQMAGFVINSPAAGDLDGDGDLEVVVTVNEGYAENPNSDDPVLSTLNRVQALGNQRVYALHHDGALHGGGPHTGARHPNPDAYLQGWPARLASVLGLLPVVGEGPDGAAVLGNVDGGNDLEVGIFGTAGPAYIFKKNGVSQYGKDPAGRDRTLRTEGFGPASNSKDSPTIPAVGGAIFSRLGTEELSLAVPSAGLGKLLDVVLPDDQLVSDNHLSVWELQSGARNQREAFPREVNDLQFLTTPASADIDGDGSEEILEGTAYSDLHAFSASGEEPGARTLAADGWPKFTGGWTVAPPAVGDFNGDGRRDIAHTIREGRLFVWRGNGARVCDPTTWPEFGHDNWNTNNVDTDATRPRLITDLRATSTGGALALTWTAPGDDGTCKRPHSYEVKRSPQPLTNESFAAAEPVGTMTAKDAGSAETFTTTTSCGTYYYAVRTYDADPATDTAAHPANPSAVSNSVAVTSSTGCPPPPRPPAPTAPTPSSPPTGSSPSPSSPTSSDSGSPRGRAASSLTADRAKTSYRGRLELSGRVTGTVGCEAPYEVTVERRVHGGTTLRPIGAGFSTRGDGSWNLRLRPRKSADYIASVADSDGCEGSRSSPVEVEVKAGVKLRSASCTTSLSVRGTVAPDHDGTRVRLDERRGSRWRPIAGDRLDRRSRFVLDADPERRCGGLYRVVWPKQSPANSRGQARFRV